MGGRDEKRRPDQNDKTQKNRDFYDQIIIGYKNYRVKNLLDLLKILQMTFFNSL